MKMIDLHNKWIKEAYQICALEGIEHLKVEQLSRKVGISKSSFYHHFVDLECFFDLIFDYHYQQCILLAQKEKACTSIYDELIPLLLEHRLDLLFHRQLRINRQDSIVKAAFLRSTEILGNYAVMLWAKEINLKFTEQQLDGLFQLATDDFYMRINKDNLDHSFLTLYFQNLSSISSQMLPL